MFVDKISDNETRTLVVVVTMSFVIKALLLLYSPLNLSADESYYWEWSRNLDWAYYSKGPVVPLLIRLGCIMFGDTELGVRCTSLVLGTLFLVGLFKVLLLITTRKMAVFTTLLFAISPFFFSLGLGATTDPPALAFLVWGVYAAIRGEKENSLIWYVGASVILGCSVLSKLTCLVVLVAFYVLVIRRLKNTWQVLLVVAAGILPLLPLLWWNMQHDWLNVLHNAGHLHKDEKSSLFFLNTITLIAGQVGIFGPIQSIVMVKLIHSYWKSSVYNTWSIAAITLCTICLVVSISRPVYANWPAPIYPLLFIGVLYDVLHRRAEDIEKLVIHWLKPAVIFFGLLLFIVIPIVLGIPLGVLGKKLPIKKLVGWRDLGAFIDRHIGEDEFLFVNRYDIGSSIAFYSRYHPEVVCGALTPRRMNQYDLWNTWDKVKGRNAIIVIDTPDKYELLLKEFREVKYVGPHDVVYQGNVIKTLHIFRGLQFNGARPSIDRLV